MTANPYQVLGATPPPMLGRAALVERVNRHLLKPSPDHVSVVGPAHYGKSVLLQHLAEAHRAGSRHRHYLTTVHVDLRHAEITCDDDFKRRLAEALKAALDQERPEHAAHLDPRDENIHEMLGLIFDELAPERVLVVLDGFDHVLAGADLTRNLWDQLRALAQKPSLRLTAGSRLPLREVCRTEESRTSDFWEVFAPTPIRVTALDEDDLRAFMQPLLDTGCTPDGSARREIANWTGGVPLLVCALLSRLYDSLGTTSRVSKPAVDQAAEAVLDEQRELLAALWDDCDLQLRSDLAVLANEDIARADLSAHRLRAIEERGFGRASGNRLRSSCRLMMRYAKERAPAVADLKRLFGSSASFEKNVRSVLDLRLAQVGSSRTDERLHDYVSRAVGDIDANPELVISSVRGIVGLALSLVWKAELPPDRALPPEWIEEWKHAGEKFSIDRGKLPPGDGLQCQVLRLATGTGVRRATGASARRVTRYVTKPTYLLLDHLQSVGNFGQHRNDSPESEVTVGFAASVALAAIALVESLTADLSREEQSARDGA